MQQHGDSNISDNDGTFFFSFSAFISTESEVTQDRGQWIYYLVDCWLSVGQVSDCVAGEVPAWRGG